MRVLWNSSQVNIFSTDHLGLTGIANSGQLVPADDCNVTVIIEDITLLPGYGDKQVGSKIKVVKSRRVFFK